MKYMDMNSALVQKKAQDTISIAPKKSGKKKFMILGVVAVFLILGGLFAFKAGSIFNPVTIAGEISTANLKETDGRINVLLLGSDQRTQSKINEGSFLTDTILVASIGTVEKNVVLMSLPRDLWVKTPSGYSTKINAVYSYGGSDELSKVVEDVLGVPIHYYAVINFDLFEDTIDSLGGVEVDVENTFTDYWYPVEGKENAPEDERYQTITFKAGKQTMDGATALKFARSRKGNNGEDTDFARSKRQQLLILAIKNKALSASTLLSIDKITSLYKSYSDNVDTDIDLASAQGFFFLSRQVQFDKVKSIVLDDRSTSDQGGLLYSPEDKSLYGGAYVLIPRAGNFSQMHAYVQRYLFGD
jgi:LCP family protein required for cell wall assembly